MAKSKGYCPKCGGSVKLMGGDFAVSGKPRYGCKDGHRTTTPLGKPPVILSSISPRQVKGNCFVVTCAQNDTALHPTALRALEMYCKHNNAQLLIVPTPYCNTDVFHVGVKEGYQWPAEITPYMIDKRVDLCANLALAADIHITPTNVSPVSGFETITGKKSTILAHPRIQMRMVATPKNEPPKMLHTTGSVSVPNYTNSKSGNKAKHHHQTGALLVETQGKNFWTRELLIDADGGFYDLDKYYTENGVTEGHNLAGVVYGDVHVKFLGDAIKKASFTGPNSIKSMLNPEIQVFHDLHDHYSQSHHHERDTILKVKKFHNNDLDVKEELMQAVAFLDDVGGGAVIESNHHAHLTQWLNRYNANKDPQNYGVANELGVMVHDAILSGVDHNPFNLFLAKYCAAPLEFVSSNDEFKVAGIDCSQHGDRGANGARPSPLSFAKSSHKMIGGHGHTPCIEGGYWQVGVSSPDMEYAKGLSSWMVTHCGIYPNGKRVLLNIINGRWRPKWAMNEKAEK